MTLLVAQEYYNFVTNGITIRVFCNHWINAECFIRVFCDFLFHRDQNQLTCIIIVH